MLWTHTDTEGIINAHATWSEALTNFRVFQYNFRTHLANYALISRIDDVIVTNQRRISESQSSGIYYGTRFGSMRTGTGNTRTTSSSITIGDVIFMVDGRPFITFTQIKDPHGLARIAKSVMKQTLKVEKLLNKTIKNNEKKIKKDLVCQTCKKSNPANSNFCNYCGNSLQ